MTKIDLVDDVRLCPCCEQIVSSGKRFVTRSRSFFPERGPCFTDGTTVDTMLDCRDIGIVYCPQTNSYYNNNDTKHVGYEVIPDILGLKDEDRKIWFNSIFLLPDKQKKALVRKYKRCNSILLECSHDVFYKLEDMKLSKKDLLRIYKIFWMHLSVNDKIKLLKMDKHFYEGGGFRDAAFNENILRLTSFCREKNKKIFDYVVSRLVCAYEEKMASGIFNYNDSILLAEFYRQSGLFKKAKKMLDLVKNNQSCEITNLTHCEIDRVEKEIDKLIGIKDTSVGLYYARLS